MTDKQASRAVREVKVPPHPLPNPYQEILAAAKTLKDAEVPEECRIMYYFVYSWWRHPIKRYKQERLLKKIRGFDEPTSNT